MGLGSHIIDSLIIGVGVTIVFLIIGVATGSIERMVFVLQGPWELTIVSTIPTWLYYTFMERSSLQGTLGKLAIGLRVTDLSGNRIGFGKATGRFFGKFISALILFIGFFMAGFTEKKQALHDIMAGCLVLKR